MDMFGDVKAFHEKFGQVYDGPPIRRLNDESEVLFRHDFLTEEVSEHGKALANGHPADQLDALVDICFVAMGTAYKHGWDFEEAWRRVVAANMNKQSVTTGGKFKISKPDGWVAPDHSDLVGDI